MKVTRYLLLFLSFITYCQTLLYAQGTNGWTQKQNSPLGTIEKATAFSVGGKGYAGSGLALSSFKKDFQQYDPKQDQWDVAEALPAEPRISAVSFSIGDKGYVGTGMAGFEGMRQGTNDLWEYDPKKDMWTQKAALPGEIRHGAIGFSIRDKGYIGLGKNKNTLYSDLWEYNPDLNQWTKKTDFPGGGREDASAFVTGGDAYVLLGQKKESTPSQKDCWKFDPVQNEWKQMADFPGIARTGALSFGYGNKGFIACGFNRTVKRLEDFWEYDTYTNQWLQKENVPFGAQSYVFSFVIGVHAYVGTGNTKKGESGSELWRYDFSFDKKNSKKFALGGSLLLGENRIPLGAVEVKIYNAKNELIKTTITGLFGSFLFMDLPNNQEYTLEVNVSDPHWKTQQIYLVNRENEPITTLNAENNFRFKIAMEEKSKLQLMKIENKNMRMDLKGKLALSSEIKTPFTDAEISLINDQQEVVQMTQTDKDGRFVFTYLPVDTNLYLTIDEKATGVLPKGTSILLMDENETVINKATATNSQMLLVSLPPEQNKLSKIYIEDSWIEASHGRTMDGMLLIENIYFEYGKSDLLPKAKTILNKVAIVLNANTKISLDILAHTDSRGEAKFNLELSEKRAQQAKNYIVQQGVNAKRIGAKGHGESKLLNKCADNTECTEDEHAKNRRMEFKIKKSGK